MKKFAILIAIIVILLASSAPLTGAAGANTVYPTSVLYSMLSLNDWRHTLVSEEYTIDFTEGYTTTSGAPGAVFSAQYSIFNAGEAAAMPFTLALSGKFSDFNLQGEVSVSCNDQELQRRVIYLPQEDCDMEEIDAGDVIAMADARTTSFSQETGILYTFDLTPISKGRRLQLEFDMDKDTRFIYSGADFFSYIGSDSGTHIRVSFSSRKDTGNNTASIFLIGGELSNPQTYYYNFLNIKSSYDFGDAVRTDTALDAYLRGMSASVSSAAPIGSQEELFITRATALNAFLAGDSYGSGYGFYDELGSSRAYMIFFVYELQLLTGDNSIRISYPFFGDATESSVNNRFEPAVYVYDAKMLSPAMPNYGNYSLRMIPPSQAPYIFENNDWSLQADDSYLYAIEKFPAVVRFSLCSVQEPYDTGVQDPAEESGEGNWLLMLIATGAVFYIAAAAVIAIPSGLLIFFVVRRRKR